MSRGLGACSLSGEPDCALPRCAVPPLRLNQKCRRSGRDDGRPIERRALLERLLTIHRGLNRPLVTHKVTAASGHRWRRGTRVAGHRQLGETDLGLLDVGTDPYGVDADPCLGRLAALAEALTVTTVELLDESQHITLGMQASQLRHDSGLHALVAIPHVELETVVDVAFS